MTDPQLQKHKKHCDMHNCDTCKLPSGDERERLAALKKKALDRFHNDHADGDLAIHEFARGVDTLIAVTKRQLLDIEQLPKELSMEHDGFPVNGRPALTWHGQGYGWRACHRYDFNGRTYWTNGVYAPTAKEAVKKLAALIQQKKGKL